MWVFISIFLSSAKVKSTVEYRPGVLELSYGQGIEPREFINLNRKKNASLFSRPPVEIEHFLQL